VATSRALTLWLPVVLWASLIFALSSVPSLSSGLGGWDYVLRKCAHVTEYAVLAFLAGVLYAASDELHQSFVRGRHASPIDVAIDSVGLLIGLFVWRRGWIRSPVGEGP
jgi:VanZ family protein